MKLSSCSAFVVCIISSPLLANLLGLEGYHNSLPSNAFHNIQVEVVDISNNKNGNSFPSIKSSSIESSIMESSSLESAPSESSSQESDSQHNFKPNNISISVIKYWHAKSLNIIAEISTNFKDNTNPTTTNLPITNISTTSTTPNHNITESPEGKNTETQAGRIYKLKTNIIGSKPNATVEHSITSNIVDINYTLVDYLDWAYYLYDFKVIKKNNDYSFIRGSLKNKKSNLYNFINIKYDKAQALPTKISFFKNNRKPIASIEVVAIQKVGTKIYPKEYLLVDGKKTLKIFVKALIIDLESNTMQTTSDFPDNLNPKKHQIK